MCVVSSVAHFSFEAGSRFKNITKNQLNPCTIVHGFSVTLSQIFGIFKTCPNRSLGSPEQLRVVSSEAHVLFKLRSHLENITKNQLNPCTIVHGFLLIWVRFLEFSKLVQNVP